MYAGRINFRFDSSPRLSLIPRRVENNKFPPFSCFGNNNSQEENSAREKISTYICKYFATMLHDSLELAYRGKNSSPFFIESRSQVKKKKEKIPSMYKTSKYLVEIKEKKRKPSPSSVSRAPCPGLFTPKKKNAGRNLYGRSTMKM